jgi:hypothetical protein
MDFVNAIQVQTRLPSLVTLSSYAVFNVLLVAFAALRG